MASEAPTWEIPFAASRDSIRLEELSTPRRIYGLVLYTGTQGFSAMDKKQKQIEVDRLSAWCSAILREINSLSPSPLASTFEDAIARSQQRRDLKGLRMASKDLEEWARSVDPFSKEKVNAALISQFGRGLDEGAEADRGALTRILARGRIENDDEYRLVSRRVDEIYDDVAFEEEVAVLNNLLALHYKRGSTES